MLAISTNLKKFAVRVEQSPHPKIWRRFSKRVVKILGTSLCYPRDRKIYSRSWGQSKKWGGDVCSNNGNANNSSYCVNHSPDLSTSRVSCVLLM